MEGKITSLSVLLTVAFVILKLIGKISWSWLWVLCPLWIGLAITFIVFVVVAIIAKVARR